MIVRCGRCRAELEVSGPGEFVCPACGTRNAVRGAAAPAGGPFDLPTVGGPSTYQPATAPEQAAPGVSWVICPSCSYRFAVGEVEQVSCPVCGTSLHRGPDGVQVADAGGQGMPSQTANP